MLTCIVFIMGVTGWMGYSRCRWIPSSEEYKSSEPGLNAWITDEFLGSCPETFGVGGKAEAMSYPNGF